MVNYCENYNLLLISDLERCLELCRFCERSKPKIEKKYTKTEMRDSLLGGRIQTDDDYRHLSEVFAKK